MGTTATLRDELDDQRDEMSRTLDAIGDRVSPRRVAERTRDATTGRLRRAMTGARDRVMGTLPGDGTVAGAAHRVQDGAGAQARAAEDTVLGATRSNALAAGAVAFGVGFLAAMVFPRSRAEERAAAQLQPQLEHAATEVGRAEHELADEMGPALREGADQVKETATSAARSEP